MNDFPTIISLKFLSFFSLLPAIALLFTGCKNPETHMEEIPPQHSSSAEVINPSQDPEGWKVLFDGHTTSGWRGINQDKFPEEGWEIQDGMLIVNASDGSESGNGGDIITTEEYSQFVLDWEWKMLTKGGNSGVKYFVKEGLSDNDKYGAGLEYQILDDENFSWMLEGKMQPGDYRTLASLYEIYPAPEKSPKPLGEWNQSRIVVQGNQVSHWLNGDKVLEYTRGSEDFRKRVSESKFNEIKNFGEAPEGHILIQDHGSKMAFRHIKIKDLD